MAGALGSSLLAETWMRPAMQSYCTPAQAYSVMNVKTLSMAGATWDEGQDHSKWAVSTSGAKPTVCIGGVNRMLSQRKRGGGTVCFARAWGSALLSRPSKPSRGFRIIRCSRVAAHRARQNGGYA